MSFALVYLVAAAPATYTSADMQTYGHCSSLYPAHQAMNTVIHIGDNDIALRYAWVLRLNVDGGGGGVTWLSEACGTSWYEGPPWRAEIPYNVTLDVVYARLL